MHAKAGPSFAPSEATVSSPHGVEVIRSEAAIPGWTATWNPDVGPTVTLRVRRVGLVQGVPRSPWQRGTHMVLRSTGLDEWTRIVSVPARSAARSVLGFGHPSLALSGGSDRTEEIVSSRVFPVSQSPLPSAWRHLGCGTTGTELSSRTSKVTAESPHSRPGIRLPMPAVRPK